jgi:hypothetical protein
MCINRLRERYNVNYYYYYYYYFYVVNEMMLLISMFFVVNLISFQLSLWVLIYNSVLRFFPFFCLLQKPVDTKYTSVPCSFQTPFCLSVHFLIYITSYMQGYLNCAVPWPCHQLVASMNAIYSLMFPHLFFMNSITPTSCSSAFQELLCYVLSLPGQKTPHQPRNPLSTSSHKISQYPTSVMLWPFFHLL